MVFSIALFLGDYGPAEKLAQDVFVQLHKNLAGLEGNREKYAKRYVSIRRRATLLPVRLTVS